MFRCKSDTLRATDRVSVFHRERMHGGPGGAACVMSTRASAQSLPTTTAAAVEAATARLRHHCHRHTPQSAVRRSGDFMACTVITLWVETAAAEAAEARSQVSDSDYNFFYFFLCLPSCSCSCLHTRPLVSHAPIGHNA